jgi:hypothetical protein
MNNEETIEAIEDGMITTLWGDAWGEHAFKHGCTEMPDDDEEEEEAFAEIVPDAPEEVFDAAKKLATMYATSNGKTIIELYEAACEADKAAGIAETNAEDFGTDLTFMAMGNPEMSLCWFDKHAQFPLTVPEWDNTELEQLADKTCEEEVEDEGDEEPQPKEEA